MCVKFSIASCGIIINNIFKQENEIWNRKKNLNGQIRVLGTTQPYVLKYM